MNLTPFKNLGESLFKITNINYLERIKYLIDCRAENIHTGRRKVYNIDRGLLKDKRGPKDSNPAVDFTKDVSQDVSKSKDCCSPKPDYKAMKRLYYMCRADGGSTKSKPSFNQAIYVNSSFERVVKQDKKPRQTGRRYLHVFLPNVTRQAGKIETSCKSVVKKDRNSYHNCSHHIKSHNKGSQQPNNKCELELPLVTFTPSLHHRSTKRNEARLQHRRQSQSQSNGCGLEKDALNEAKISTNISKADLYDVMKWKIL